ncbi:unnamed protein product [Xylocopa violacea]|uniref:CHK kinase-like domain-containing protein n=1 Tax=Xylocopa violacea TaxID=135666 RepID=A0ABP1NC41_XYLVO
MAAISADQCRLNDPALSQACPVANESSLLLDSDVDKIVERKLRTTNFRVSQWRLEQLEKVDGFLGQYHRLYVTVKTGDRTERFRFFAKALPLSGSHLCSYVVESNALNKEIAIYSELIPRLGPGTCSKWSSDFYLGKSNAILVLEDAKENGYETVDRYLTYDEDHCVWAVRTFSVLHSRSLILDEKLRRSTGQTMLDVYGEMLSEVGLNTSNPYVSKFLQASCIGAESIIDLVEGLTSVERAALKQWANTWISRLPQMITRSKKFRNLISHGDVWANNIMFKEDSNGKVVGCYLVDMQYVRFSPPAIDFMMVSYLTTDYATRKQCYARLLDVYYDTMKKELASEGLDVERCLPRAEFLQSCDELRATVMAFALAYLPIMLISNDTLEKYSVKSSEGSNDVLHGDKRVEVVMLQWQITGQYKQRLTDLIIEIRDRLAKRELGDTAKH